MRLPSISFTYKTNNESWNFSKNFNLFTFKWKMCPLLQGDWCGVAVKYGRCLQRVVKMLNLKNTGNWQHVWTFFLRNNRKIDNYMGRKSTHRLLVHNVIRFNNLCGWVSLLYFFAWRNEKVYKTDSRTEQENTDPELSSSSI